MYNYLVTYQFTLRKHCKHVIKLTCTVEHFLQPFGWGNSNSITKINLQLI